ncbi:MAG TPA: hypothetical protein VM510_03650 [Caulifigura sp.]|nr:hypothetical protein [Caulifigura sp.]
MTYDELIVLVPCHSLEDFPTELGESPAESLLNAFASAWHPALLFHAGGLPQWRRADDFYDAPQPSVKRLIFVPQPSEDWLGHDTLEQLKDSGATILKGLVKRSDYVDAGDPELIADFHALGLTWLMTELLTRHMRNIADVDRTRLEIETVAAAKAAMAGDRAAAERHLQRAFETLLECRERFYPVDCWLIDLCLISPTQANTHFERLCVDPTPVSLVAAAEDIASIADANPALVEQIREGLTAGRLGLVGGDWRETGGVLRSIQHTLWNMTRGRRELKRILGSPAKVWGRRRYGLTAFVPQLVSRFSGDGALHFVMDDGLYPDEEQTKFRWQGCDGSVIDAISRIPLPGDSASSFLRFPQRLAESMDNDHAAGMIFARWPELRTPFLDDFRRAARYSPVMGRFSTLDQFLTQTEMPGRMETFKPGSYFSPFLVQSVARQQADPISRYIREWSLRHRLESISWCADMTALMTTGAPDAALLPPVRDALELAEPDAAAGVHEELKTQVADLEAGVLDRLRDILAPGGPGDAGWLVVNPWSFARKAVVSVPSADGFLTAGDAVSAVHVSDEGSSAVVELPPCGFTWIPRQPHAPVTTERQKLPSADGLVLRNEFFEVMLSDATGGIAQIRTFRRSPNRLSQQLALRYPRERTITTGEGENAESYKSYYTEMQLKESRVLEASPAVGAVETVGSLVDQMTGEAVADFQQVTRVRRGRPVVEVDIELTPHKELEGDPWSNYFGVRWAWKWESVAVSRSLFQTAHALGDEPRFESPHFIEIADDIDRTTIVTHGLTFHRKIGPRMVDTLLVTAGETRRRFRFDIAIDERYPQQTALDAMSPPIVLRCAKKPAIPEAWLMHVSARNVIVLGLLPLDADESGARPQGCIVRLLETEGRHRAFALKTFRSPVSARQRDFIGQTVQQCRVAGDETTVEIAPYEICDIELKF